MPRKKKINIKDLKKDLLEDLDQFLLEENFTKKEVKNKKEEALNYLDKLIKEDLSYNQILTEITERVQEDEEIFDLPPSNNILDLRQAKIEKPKEKINKLEKYKGFKTKFKEKFTRKKIKEELYYPKPIKKSFNISLNIDTFKLKSALSRTIVFALITAVILLPIRGLVIFGQIIEDKNKILEFGQQGITSMQSGTLLAADASYELAQTDFANALDSFNNAENVLNEYHNWMFNAASVVPVVGKQVSLSRNMIIIANDIAEAANILNNKLKNNEYPTEYLYIINNQIEKSLPYLRDANKDLQDISTGILPQDLQVYFDNLKEYLPKTINDLENLNEVFDVLINILGHSSQQRYLVLFQNNNELRATGGFLGSFALTDLSKGKIINLEVPERGLYDLEAGQKVKIKSPKALSIINPHFNIWDANWWPDFPTSAKKISEFYANAENTSIDGVISINASVLQELLTILGPIILDEYNITVTENNVFDVLQEETELNYNKEENTPKAVIADLVPIVLDRLLSDISNNKEVLSLFVQMLANKNIQIYLNNEGAQEKIHDFAWSGEILSNDKDYLNIINTNIAGGKTDNDIYQIIDHQAEINNAGEIINTVRITRTNKGDENNIFAGLEGGNVSYIRIFTPLNSEFIEARGFDYISEAHFDSSSNLAIEDDILRFEEDKMIDGKSNTEIFTSLNKTVFANWMALKPGETKTVSVKYKLPFKLNLHNSLVNDWTKLFMGNLKLDNYSLLIQSQSGRDNTIINSSVLLPNDIKVIWNIATEEDKTSITDYLVSYSNELVGDQYFGFIAAKK